MGAQEHFLQLPSHDLSNRVAGGVAFHRSHRLKGCMLVKLAGSELFGHQTPCLAGTGTEIPFKMEPVGQINPIKL